MKERTRRLGAVGTVVLMAVSVLTIGGTAVAAQLITGKDIINGSIKGIDIANRAISGRDLKSNAVKSKHVKDNTIRGKDVRDGTLEAKDLDPSARGITFVAQRLTPVATSGPGTGLNVVDVPVLAGGLTTGGPTATEGAELFPSVTLTQGTYIVEGTIQFFDFTPDAQGLEYGVARLFLDGTTVSTLWSPDVPDDGNNAAQTSGSTIITVPAGGGTLTARVGMRSVESDGGQAGGNLIVTKIPS